MRKWLLLLLLISGIAAGFFWMADRPQVKTEKNDGYEENVRQLRTDMIRQSEIREMDIRLNGISLKNFGYQIRIDENLRLLCQERMLEDVMGCSIVRYSNGNVTVEHGDTVIRLEKDSTKAKIGDQTVDLMAVYQYDETECQLYLPAVRLMKAIGYQTTVSYADNMVNFEEVTTRNPLPARYDMREKDRVTPVRDQGRYGTCWAFASLGALETTLMPYEKNTYSTDHMTLNNSYRLDPSAGGGHTMSIAYLAAWQGPVYEEDDPYGDGETVQGLSAVKHLEEAIVINERDDEIIKGAIYRYGGVETSLYLEMEYTDTYSKYYNQEKASYFYDGEEKPNHDVVVVGWDDDFPKENFSIQPEKNGAYICKNSWGENFGEKGYFYVSYEDINICSQSIIYTRLEDPDNFQYIYQSDLMGWVGELGFGKEDAFFANCYVPLRDEELAGVSFYATGPRTTFSVYYVPEVKSTSDLSNREFLVSGETRYAGYYTVKIPNPPTLTKGQKYAVVIKISTPGSKRPIAVEYAADERSGQADISDGEGYISLYGEAWNSAEAEGCNVCLKTFTNDRKEDAPDENDTGQDGGTRDGSGSNEEQGEDGNREE